LLQGDTGLVKAAAYSPDGQNVVTVSEDGLVRIWDVASGTEVRRLLGDMGIVTSAA
jgi:WD40 repeat protein